VRTPLLLIAVALLAACSEDVTPTQAQAPTVAPPPTPAAAPAKGDAAAAEMAEPADPCDLSGYDMSKMTADHHEQLVKACADSKQ